MNNPKDRMTGIAKSIKQFFTKKRRVYKPYLVFVVDLKFAHLRTALMHQAIERYSYDYINLEWKFFKWNGKFRLYRPGKDF